MFRKYKNQKDINMQEIKITENQAGLRFDKFLFKFFKEATSFFIYNMISNNN